MSKSQRNKGNAGERELFKLLSEELGFVVRRNLSQTRGGGADCIEIKYWSVEVKRQEKLSLSSWWQQTLDQCSNKEKPILFFRQSRYPWSAMIRLTDIINIHLLKEAQVHTETRHNTVITDFDTACLIIRESL